jgi:transcriptional regulator with AAA-type ATPase domain
VKLAMKLYVMLEGATLRAWDLAAGVYLIGSGARCDRVLDPRVCPWEVLCQVEVQEDRLILSAIGGEVALMGPNGKANLVVLKNFETAQVGPFRLGALQELRPPDFLAEEGVEGDEPAPTAPSDGVEAPVKEPLFFQVTSEKSTRQYQVKNLFAIGRDARCASRGLRLTNPAVSAQQAQVVERQDGFYLTDPNSANGTYVNGVVLQHGGELRLEPGMVVRFTRSSKVPFVEVLAGAELAKGRVSSGLIGESAAMREIRALIFKMREGKFPILLISETGTGKEVLAREIARLQNPRKGLTVVDCTTLTETLLESELFGSVVGAFTGATDRVGLIEGAAGGVLLIDEIGEMSLGVQAKLLRFLQEHTIRRSGSNVIKRIDCRVVAATHRDLKAMVAAGRFRQDLYERLQGNTLRLPPLRERKEDILPIARDFLEKREASNRPTLSPAAALALHDHDWPGNVRELLRLVEIAAFRSDGAEIEESTVRALIAERTAGTSAATAVLPKNGPERVRAYERALMKEALDAHGGKWYPAAIAMGYAHNTFHRRAIEYGLLEA